MNFNERLERGKHYEQLIAAELEKTHIVYRQINDGSTWPDMYIFNKETKKTTAVEVKTQRPLQWRGAKCYTMPTKNWNEYLKFALDNAMDFYIFYVNPDTNYIFLASVGELAKSKTHAGLSFPLTLPRDAFEYFLHDKTLFLESDFLLFGALDKSELN
jgi:hypothetical protein